MKMIKKFISLCLSAVMTMGLCTSFTRASDTGSKSIGNDFLVFSVNDNTGYFSIHTREGHPQKAADNNISLLYDGDSIETSFTTVRIDGKDYIFGQDYGFLGSISNRAQSTVDAVNNIISTKWTINDIEITQKAKISRTDNTSLTGNVNLSYEVVNNSGKDHNVGIRVLLDNSLGDIDAPVVMAESEPAPIIKETEFFTGGRDPGDYIRYVDSVEQPSKEAYLSFSNEYASKPDKVIAAHWYHLATTKWEYTPDKDFVFDNGFNDLSRADTATTVFFNEVNIPSGQRLEKGLVYGIGDFTDGYVNSDFNMTLELLNGIELEGNKYKNDGVVDAIVHIYNNVDLSEDIQSAKLNLSCETGLEFLFDDEEPDPDDPTTAYEIVVGFVPKGMVVSYPVNLRASVQSSLTALEVSVKATGNDPDKSVVSTKYVIAPSVSSAKASFSIDDIEAKKYHISGQRAMTARGIIPKDFMDDRTKWKAAFVHTDHPDIRYDIASEDISISTDNIMSVIYNGDMVIGNYSIEVTFFEDYKDIFVDVYTSKATFAIVDDPSLAVQQYGILAVVRTGASTMMDYKIHAMNSEEQYSLFSRKIDESNIGQSALVAEIVLVLRGVFIPQRDSYGNVKGYKAAEDSYKINGIIAGKKGDTIDYIDVSFDEKGEISGYDGVLVSGAEGYHINGTWICDCAWEIRLLKNQMHTLADRSSIRVDFSEAHNSVFMNLAGFMFNFKFAALGFDHDIGYSVSFGGKIMLSWYFKDAPVPKITDAGYQPTEHHTADALKANRMNLYASADVKDVLFTDIGFYGINTSVDIGVALSSLIKTVRKDTFMLHLDIDTFNDDYFGSGTITLKGYTVTLGLGFKSVYQFNGKIVEGSYKGERGGVSLLALDDLTLSVTVPPTAPIPIYPPLVSLTRFGGGVKNLTDLLPTDISEPQDILSYINDQTAELSAEIGVLIVRLVSLDCFGNLGVNHINVTGVISGPKFPGLTVQGTLALQWKIPEMYENGTTNITDVGGAVSIKLNVFSIFIGDAAISGKLNVVKDENGEVDLNTYASLNIHGGLFIPVMVPIIGGMEVVGVSGLLDTTGLAVTFVILNNEIVYSYNFDDDDGTWLMDESGDTSGFGVSNMQVLRVDVSEDATLLSDNQISGIITSKEGRTTLIAVKYRGETPDVSSLKLTVDGTDRPLVLASAEGKYSDGNIFIMPSDDGGKIYFGTKGIDVGKHEYILTNDNEGTVLELMEAASFAKNVKPSSVIVNSDGTYTVTSDSDLRGSKLKVFAVSSKEDLDEIVTEKVVDEDGNIGINVYRMVDGEKVPYIAENVDEINEYLIYESDITEETSKITFTPEFGNEVAPGEYYLKAVVISPYKASTSVYSEGTVTHENELYPAPVTSGTAVSGGNRSILVEVNEPEGGVDGYYVNHYADDKTKYEGDTLYFAKDEQIRIYVTDTSKKYVVEIQSVNYDDDENLYCSEPYIIGDIEVKEPEKVSVSLELVTETVPVEIISESGEKLTVNYIKGNKAVFNAVTDEPVYGTFMVDGMDAGSNAELSTSFRYESEFDDGTHYVGFVAIKENGDETYADSVVFDVETDKPSLMVENAIVEVVDGKITVNGISSGAEKIIFNGKEYTPETNGNFTFEAETEFDRFAQRYEIRAIGYTGYESISNILAVRTDYQPIDRIEILADGVSNGAVTLQPGESTVISACGFAGDIERDISDTVYYVVVNGNSSVSFDEGSNTIKAVAPGTAYVKVVYDMGRYINNDITGNYVFEDILEINVMKKAPYVTSSHPNGAKVAKNAKITLSANGAEIRYTTDGSDPTEESPLYKGSITVSEDITIRARAYNDGFTPGDISQFKYTVRKNVSGADGITVPSTVPTGGNNNQDFGRVISNNTSETVPYGFGVTLTNNVGGIIYYTTDGSTPDNTRAVYSEPIIITKDTVIKAVSYYGDGEYGNVYEFVFTLDKYYTRLRTDMNKSLLINGYPDGTFKPDNNLTRAETATLLRRAVVLEGYVIRDDIFSDVDMWAKDSINQLASAGIVNGYLDGTFKPYNSVTRAEFITMLMRIIGENGTEVKFADAKGHWAEKHLAKAVEYGYIGGYPDGTLRPDNLITRAEALVILSRVFNFDTDGKTTHFTDVTKQHWAFGYIAD